MQKRVIYVKISGNSFYPWQRPT